MGCATGIVKLLVFGANLIFALAGIALIVIGVVYKTHIDFFYDAEPEGIDHFQYASILTIVVGSIIFVIAFFGCCGALRMSQCLLVTYSVLLLILFLSQVALGVYAFLEISDKDDLKNTIQTQLTKIQNDYYNKNVSREVFDTLQQELKCCGVTTKLDWKQTILPSSCCGKKSNETCTVLNAYDEPCRDALYDFVTGSMQVLGITVLSICGTEVIGMIFALCLTNSIRNDERRYRGHM